MPIRVADYLAHRLAEHGVRHIFMVTGGGAMFLNDALGHHPELRTISNHHEQASAMAAEGYARISGRLGVLNVTTGPGGINALNGVFGAWTDSIPLLVISGQVKRATCLGSFDLPLRQLGDQEVDIVAMAKSITKYSALVLDPSDIAWHIDRALHFAETGRPGPVWLDIPIDVQAAQVEPSELRRFIPEPSAQTEDVEDVEALAASLVAYIRGAYRPVIMAGSGVRISGALTSFEQAIDALGVPVVTAWCHDLIASDHPLFCGRPGTIGTRTGNFTVQNATLVLVLGSRLNIRQTSYNWESFAHDAQVIQIDIDPAELDKPTYSPDVGVVCDLATLLPALARAARNVEGPTETQRRWLAWCRNKLSRYPNVQAAQRHFQARINPYHFVDRLFAQLSPDDIIVCGNASACIIPFQVAQLQAGQRMFSNSGSASMGYALPAAIGAWFGALRERGAQGRIICLTGDGSLQMNVQELQTVAHHGIPLKIFILDNAGYLSIRGSQGNFFGRFIGEGPGSGVSFPDFVKLGQAYGLPSSVLDAADFERGLQDVLGAAGPSLCRVVLDDTQGFEPRMRSKQLADGTLVSPELEDMYPFLDREELAANMSPPLTTT